MYQQKSIKGIVCVAIGLIVFLMAVGDFILRALAACAAILLINYGLRLCGRPPLQHSFYIWVDRIRF